MTKQRQARLITILAAVFLLLFVEIAFSGPASAWTWNQTERNKDLAHEIAEQMRAAGHPENHPVILACQAWWQEEDAKEQQEAPIFTTEQQRREYPVAAALWQYLREAGLPEIQAAAALGNAMAESGGHTLDIDLYQYVDGFYGPWAMSTQYFPTVYGKGAKGIVEELMDSLEWNMKDKGGSVDTWMALTDVREAARYFGIYWEAPRFYNAEREANAVAALEYFGGGAG